MMGTRIGDRDPGVLVHLLGDERFDAAAVARLVDHGSGLLGVSDTTSDMRTPEAPARTIRTLRTDEDLMIARHTRAVMAAQR
jgi:acetate kinase